MTNIKPRNLLENQAEVDFSILIPVFNSQFSLPLVLEGVREVFDLLEFTFEFVLVDDASSDDSWPVIEQEYSKGDVTGLRFLRNQGHSVALKRGLEFCQGKWVVTMDDDLQHPPHELKKLLEAATNNDVDVVMGSYPQARSQVHKSLGARFYQLLLQEVNPAAKNLTITSFRVLHRRVVDEIISKKLASPHAGFVILGATDRIINVPVQYKTREFGQSGMTFKKSLTVMLEGTILNSTIPLKLVGFTGLAASATAAVLGIYYLLTYLISSNPVSGFTTLVLLILGFSGVILLSLTVIGLYISKILKELHFSPKYSLRNYLPISRVNDIPDQD